MTCNHIDFTKENVFMEFEFPEDVSSTWPLFPCVRFSLSMPFLNLLTCA